MKTRRRIPKAILDLKGFNLGQFSVDERLIPRGGAKTLQNYRFTELGPRSRLGWTTVDDFLTASHTHTWTSSVEDMGFFTGFCASDSGKVITYEYGLYRDTDGTTEDFIGGARVAVPAGQMFMGCFYFAAKFYVYTKEKIYELTIADGTLTEKIDFGDDLGTNYDNVIRMFPRFGQIWGVSENGSRVFFSDTGIITKTDGTPVTDEPLQRLLGEWQTVSVAGAIGSVTVKYMFYNGWEVRKNGAFGKDIIEGTNRAYVAGDPTGEVSNGDAIAAHWAGQARDVQTYDTGAANTLDLSADVSAGSNTIVLTNGADQEMFYLRFGEAITISDDAPNTETAIIKSVTYLGSTAEIVLEANLTNGYTTGNNAKITSQDIWKIKITGTWNYSREEGASIVFENWSNATLNTDYTLSANYYADPNADGHIRMIDTFVMRAATRFKVDYTPTENSWQDGNAGFMDVAKEQGKIVDYAETAVGLYIFKKNPGAIYLIAGEPGPGGTAGTLQIRKIYDGVTAEYGSIQVCRNGVYFSAFDMDKLDTYFLPLVTTEVDEIPKLTDFHNPPIPSLGSSALTFTTRTALVHGDSYLIVVLKQSGGTGVPTAPFYHYLCQAYYDGTRWRGRWAQWAEDQSYEWSGTYGINDYPRTIGWYEHGGKLFRAYIVKNDQDADEQDYQVARYGQADGTETPKDRVYMLSTSDGSTPLLVTYNDGFNLDIETGWINELMLDDMQVRFIHFQADITAGNFSMSIYTDHSTSALITKTAASLSNVEGSEAFLNWIETNFWAQYIKFLFRLTDVDADSAGEEYAVFKNVLIEYSPKARKGNTAEADY